MSGVFRRRWFWVVLFFAAVNISGLAIIIVRLQPPGLEIESFTPVGEASRRPTLKVRFSEIMVAAEEVGKFVPAEFVTMTPETPGDFIWHDTRTLRFIPEAPLPLATSFAATLSDETQSLAGRRLGRVRTFTFQTPRLHLNRVRQVNITNDRRVTLALAFNDKVDLDELASHLTLKDPGGAILKYEVLDREAKPTSPSVPPPELMVPASSRDVVRIRTQPVLRGIIRLNFAKGLRGESGPLGFEEDWSRTFVTEPGFVIEDVRARALSRGMSTIRVHCTQSVSSKRLRDFIRIEPPVKFTVSTRYYGFSISGPFKPATNYRVTFLKGLRGRDEMELDRTVVRRAFMPDLPSEVRFASPGIYLASQSSRRLPLECVNVKTVELSVEEVYRNNLVHYVRGFSRWRQPSDLGRVRVKRTISVATARNEKQTVPIDLREILGVEARGAFLITVRDKENSYRRARKLVLLSDMGMTVKQSPSDLLVWVNTLSPVAPVGSASVTVYSRTSQEILEGATDASGIVHFRDVAWTKENGPYVAVAVRGDDVALIEIDANRLSMSSFDIGGRPYLTKGYEAFVYADRGIYRPGETVNVHGIVRSAGADMPRDFPVRFRIKRPDGQEFATCPATLSRWGSADVSVVMPKYALTGRYSVALMLPHGKKPIGARTFQVEEYVPDRMKVRLAAPDRRHAPGDEVTATVHAHHLFGAPAKGRRARVTMRLHTSRFTHPKWPGYRFHDSTRNFSARTLAMSGDIIGDDGQATFTEKLPRTLRAPGALRLIMTGTVREVGGRTVTDSMERPVDPYARYVGLRHDPKTPVRPGQAARVQCAFVRPDGTPVPQATLKARIVRVWWNTVLKYDPSSRWGRYRYVSEREEETVTTVDCAIADGRGVVAFTPPTMGRYDVRVCDGDQASADLTLWAYHGGSAPWAMDKPDRLEIVTDRKTYRVGETARVTVKAPFGGTVLFTLESDRIRHVRTFLMTGNTCEVDVPVEAGFGPNVYCTATVLRRIEPGKGLTTHRAYGTAPLRVDPASRRLSIEVVCKDEVRPGKPLAIQIDVHDAEGFGKECELTLAAVDEGICRLTRYRTPDPWAFFCAKRRLGVSTADIYSRVIAAMAEQKVGADSAAGGGGPGGYDARRLNPVAADRVRSVALWKSGIVTDANGRATVILDVPEEFNGELRLMAVAASARGFGAEAKAVRVRGPLMVRASLPRFLAPGDEFDLPVTVFNHTGALGEARVTVGAERIDVVGERTNSLTVKSDGESTTWFHLRAPRAPGKAVIRIHGVLGSERDTRTVEVAVRPPSGLQHAAGHGHVVAGTKASFVLPDGWLKGTDRFRLNFSARPTVMLSGSLRYLVRYPYGCLEQTTSSAFPLLYLSDLAAAADPETFTHDEVAVFVQGGIARLIGKMTHRGGFATWEGHSRAYDWGTVYATHFLAEAKKAGYVIPKGCLERALKYLESMLTHGGDTRDTRATRAYACYVLAHAGRPNASWTFRLHEARKDLPGYSRFHLAAALALMGERKLGKAIALAGPTKAEDRHDTGGVLHSPIREAAILLSVYLELQPDSPHVVALAKRLAGSMRQGRWRSTQENAFALMALGKYMRTFKDRKSAWRATVTLDGKPVAALTEKTPLSRKLRGAGGKKVVVDVVGEGDLFYTWSVDGVRTSGKAPEYDRGMTVRRRWLARDGKPVDPQRIPQGDLLIVELVVENERAVRNVVICDLLPAGFEIENPRLATREVPNVEAVVSLHPDRVERRDDRMLLFTDLGSPGRRVFHYAVRAVTAGRFTAPAVQAECMYDPTLGSLHGAGEVRVRR